MQLNFDMHTKCTRIQPFKSRISAESFSHSVCAFCMSQLSLSLEMMCISEFPFTQRIHLSFAFQVSFDDE